MVVLFIYVLLLCLGLVVDCWLLAFCWLNGFVSWCFRLVSLDFFYFNSVVWFL